METLFAILAKAEGNPPSSVDSSHKGLITRALLKVLNGCPCIVENRGMQGCALVGDLARAVGECRNIVQAQPYVPPISAMHRQPFLIPFIVVYLMLAWRNGWPNSRVAGDLIPHDASLDCNSNVTVLYSLNRVPVHWRKFRQHDDITISVSVIDRFTFRYDSSENLNYLNIQ